MIQKTLSAAFFLGLTLAGQARTEVPIKEVDLSDGTRRYSIPITVGTTHIEAGLDTGSTGLRVLPHVLADSDAKSSGRGNAIDYGAGTRLEGNVATGDVGVGDLHGPVSLQLVTLATCASGRRGCPASKIPAEQFGVQGNGLPGEGFKAIFGTNMGPEAVDNPLAALGARQWIVELPRPGSPAPGRLILNPSPDESKDFTMLPLVAGLHAAGGFHDTVTGCLMNADTKARACGPTLMDSGAPGIVLMHGDIGSTPWPNGTNAILALYDAKGLRVAIAFPIGARAAASHLDFQDNGIGVATTRIMSGLTAYFAFDVLYDPAAGQIGFRLRPPENGAPLGRIMPAADAR